MTITTTPERRTKTNLMPSLVNPTWTEGRTEDRSGWYAEVESGGLVLQVSKLDADCTSKATHQAIARFRAAPHPPRSARPTPPAST